MDIIFEHIFLRYGSVMEKQPGPYTITTPYLSQYEEITHVRAQSWIDTYPNEAHGVSEEWVRQRVNERSLSPQGLLRRQELLAESLNNPQRFFFRIAQLSDSTIIGFCEGNKQSDCQELLALYVKSEYHGSGAASQLIRELLNWYDPNQNVELTVAAYNTRAIAFYQKWDFYVVPDSTGIFAK